MDFHIFESLNNCLNSIDLSGSNTYVQFCKKCDLHTEMEEDINEYYVTNKCKKCKNVYFGVNIF